MKCSEFLKFSKHCNTCNEVEAGWRENNQELVHKRLKTIV